MNINTVLKRAGPEITIIALIFLSAQFVTRPLPAIGSHTDIWVGTHFMIQLASGKSILSIRDPYLRYVPQAVLFNTVGSVMKKTNSLAMSVYVEYTLILTTIVTPTVAYFYARINYRRRIGIVALALFGLVGTRDWFSLVPHIPQFILTQIPRSTNWGGVSSSILGTTYYFSPQLQYAFCIPFVLCAFTIQSQYSSRLRLRYGVLTGVMLGIAGSIQVIQGLTAALVVGLYVIKRREWEQLGIISTTAAITALPNLAIILRFGNTWFHQGSNRIALGPANLALLILFILLSASIMIYVSIPAWTIIIDVSRVPNLITIAQRNFNEFTATWLLTTITISYLTIPLNANWYRWLVEGIMRYGLIIAVAVLITPYLTQVLTERSETT